MAPASERLQFRFPGYGDGVLHRMDQLREQRRFCDVTVQVNELRVPGHRVVFAACSPFLRDQFLLNDSQEVTVSLFQSPEIGRQLLLSCYTGCLDVPIKELVNYLTAASFLQMGHVVERCAQAVSHYLVPKADALLQEKQEEESSEQQDGEEEEEEEEEREKQPSSTPGKADCEESKMAAVEFTPRSSHGPASPAISLSLINSAVEITRSYLQGCYDDEMGSKGLPFPSATPSPASQWRNYPLHRHRPAMNYREWRTGSGVASWKVPGLERPYRCPRCSRVFQQLGHLVSHVQEHKLFLCLRCGKVFSQKSNLTRHIRVHTGFKPFQCPICRKCFTQNATLQDHLNLHSGIKPHKCNYCEMHFTHKPGLRRHLKELHGKSTVQNSHEEIEEVTIDFDVRGGHAEGGYSLNGRFFCEPKGGLPAPASSL
ncbi:zinc finger and BTB domain-containing protein 26-like [Thamnophis elegans]|uniref:zinc finger and BTB domain-containing protein 26-like n=1 Tax=Thamnophis elegans TaxID=35005 RepID=UPI0013778956|nr:zinc finger and BTB domain-containing protein 26-like [Thamnophis elegans]